MAKVFSDGMKFLSPVWEYLFAKPSTRSMKANFRRTHRDAEFLGDCFMRQAVHVAQHDHSAQAIRQVLNCGLQFVSQSYEITAQGGVVVGSSLG